MSAPHALPSPLAALLATAASILPGPAAGATCDEMPLPPECLTFAFTASTVEFDDPNGAFGSVAGSVSGTYTFDASVADLFPGDPTVGAYPDAVACATVDLGDRTYQQELQFASNINATDDQVIDETDPLIFIADTYVVDLGLDDARVDGQSGTGEFVIELAEFCIEGMGPCPPDATDGDALPTTPPDPNAFTATRELQLRFTPTGAFLASTYLGAPTSLTAVEPVPCPEPGAGAAALAGALALISLGVRRARR